MSRNIRWGILLSAVLFCGVLLFWYMPASRPMPDMCYYVQVARNVFSGKFYLDHRAGVDLYMTAPLYPIFIKAFSVFTRNYEIAGTAVSMMSAMLVVLVLYAFGKKMFSLSAGLIAAWLAACAQAEIGTLILTEGLFTLLNLIAIWLVWETIQSPSFKRAALAGVFTALATLTREMGFILAPFGIAAIILAGMLGKEDRADIKMKSVQAAIFGLVTCLTISPYWIYSLMLRGTWWGSRFSERAGHGDEILFGTGTFISAIPAGARAVWETYPVPVTVAALIGIVAPSAWVPSRKDLSARIFLVAWILVNVVAIGMLKVDQVKLWSRYIYPAAPLLLLFAARGTEAAMELSRRYLSGSKPDRSPIAGYVAGGAVVAALVFSLLYRTGQLRNYYIQPSMRNTLFTKGSEEVARDLLSRYRIGSNTYVYDRKPFLAYYLGVTWAGLPEKVNLAELEQAAASRPVLLAINSGVLSNYSYPQLGPLLAGRDIPKGWHLVQMSFFPDYGVKGRLITVYAYGSDFPAPQAVKPADATYEGRLQEANKWLEKYRIDLAQAHAEAAISLDPSRSEAYTLLANIYFIEGSKAKDADVLADSIGLLRKALLINPQNAEISKGICIVSQEKSRIDGSKPMCGPGQ